MLTSICRTGLLFLFITIASTNLFGSNKLKSLVSIVNYDVKLIDSKENIVEITCSLEFLTSSNVKVELNIPEDIRKLSESSGLSIFKTNKNFSSGELLCISQKLKLLSNSSNYRVDIKVERDLSSTESNIDDQYTKFISIPVYFSVEQNEIKYVNVIHPERKYTDPPVIVDSKGKQKKLEAEYVAPYSTSTEFQSLVTDSYDITVYIAGRISYSSSSAKGIPDVAVRLDWDYDNNPQTGYTPYDGGNTLHVEYDKTDMNGNYYFSFRFVNSPYPANYYSNKIRVYATNSNSACFDHDLGNGAQISEYFYLDISSSTTSVYSASANISNVEVNQGSALRYLYRARLFSINNLGYTPPTIRYLIRPTFSTSCFCDPDESFLGLFFSECQNTTMSVPRIIFNHLPEDNATAYHEYGHFVEWAKVGVQVYDDLGGEGHWFEKSTTHKVAWTEGWAEFYAAACLMYWYSTELPASPEYIVSTKYQWMDYSQSLLSSGVDNKTVEGAVACFLYSLWDGISQRAPNYSGDNDDLVISGATLLNRIQSRWNLLGELIAPTHIEAYKNSLINGVDSKYHSSINALYSSIINQSGIAYSATPSVLNISGNSNSRTLSWNDNTAPANYSWGSHYVDIVENNEQGFRIYRKATTSGWDGTLNGYTLVGTVGQNTTTWTDNTSLIGGHSYVVVAYNGTGNSLPRAESSVYYQPPLAVTISGPSYLGIGQSGTWTASASGGTAPYHYQWWYMHPSNILQSLSIIKPDNIPLDTWFTLGTDSPTLSRYDSQNFNLKCVVTDATNTQVTSNIISVSVGGSLAKISGTDSEQANDKLTLAEELPTEYSMGNYPNPFNPTTKINFSLPNDGHVSLKVFDILGREVAVLANKVFLAGRYEFDFNASNLPSGTYIYSLRTDSKTITKKMLLVK